MPHPAMSPNNVAVITGGASGIGLAAAMHFARLGMKVCIADLGADRLKQAETKLSSLAPGGAADIMTAAVDVSHADEVAGLESAVRKRFGGTGGSCEQSSRRRCTPKIPGIPFVKWDRLPWSRLSHRLRSNAANPTANHFTTAR